MILLNKISTNKLSLKTNYLNCIKLYNDFLFFIFLIKEYITLQNIYSLHIIKHSIYLLNLTALKYIIYNKYHTFFNLNNSKLYCLELFYWTIKKFNCSIPRLKNITQKILLIKKVSRTRAKGRVKRYKVILLIGNKSGWFGIGYSKDYYLQEAISKARLHAFKNIYQVPLLYCNILNNNIFYLQKKSKKIYLFSSKYKLQTPTKYSLRVLFEFIGINNISSKIIGINNIYKILSLLFNL